MTEFTRQEAVDLMGVVPKSHTLKSWARLVLSMEIEGRPYLGRRLTGDNLDKAKAHSKKVAEAARCLLREDGSSTIWYYKSFPTKGNQFGACSIG